jgi:DNA repair protein RadC
MRVYEAKLVYSLLSLGENITLDWPNRVAEYLASAYAENPVQEAFYVIPVDRKNHPLARIQVTIGIVSACLVHPREVFRPAILAGASAIVVSHNHPSGDPAPSAADVQITRQLREASKAVDIQLLDHVIVGDKVADPLGCGYYSFRQAGLL